MPQINDIVLCFSIFCILFALWNLFIYHSRLNERMIYSEQINELEEKLEKKKGYINYLEKELWLRREL